MSTMLFFRCLPLLILIFSLPSHAHSPHDEIDAMAISPNYISDQTLFLASGDHLLRSTNQGSSWKELMHGLDNHFIFNNIAISSQYSSDHSVYASTLGGAIYASHDSGNSWNKTETFPNNKKIVELYLHQLPDHQRLIANTIDGLFVSEDDGKNWTQSTGISSGTLITAFATGEQNSKQRWVAGTDTGDIYFSDDFAKSWQQVPDIQADSAITSVGSGLSKQGLHVFIGSESGQALFSSDNANTFEVVEVHADIIPLVDEQDPDNTAIISIVFSPNYARDNTIFLDTWNQGVFISNDAAKHWHYSSDGLTTDHQADKNKAYNSPHFRKLVISQSFKTDGTALVGGFDGVFITQSSGKHWRQLELLPLRLIKNMDIANDADNNIHYALATYGGGTYTKTADDEWTIGNFGLSKTRIFDIAFSPEFDTDQTMFSAMAGALIISNDAGKSWRSVEFNPRNWRMRTHTWIKRIGLSGNWEKSVYLRKGDIRTSPYITRIELSKTFSQDKTVFIGTRWHGIYRSTDGGETIKHLWEAKEVNIPDVAISPQFSEDQTVLASLSGYGIYRSTDAGDHWNESNTGLDFIKDWNGDTVSHSTNKFMKISLSPEFASDKTAFTGGSEGLYRSFDSGTSWEKLSVIENTTHDNEYVISLRTSPNFINDKTILVSLRGNGLFISTDKGEHFEPFATQLKQQNESIEMIQFSTNYENDHTIVVASDEQLLKSTDNGISWTAESRPTRNENIRDTLTFEGDWKLEENTRYSAKSISISSESNDSVSLYFYGTGVRWIGPKGQRFGQAFVSIDDKKPVAVDQSSENEEYFSTIFEKTDLPLQGHKILIQHAKNATQDESNKVIAVDAIDVMP